jgi:RNA polymerase sigma-B factor
MRRTSDDVLDHTGETRLATLDRTSVSAPARPMLPTRPAARTRSIPRAQRRLLTAELLEQAHATDDPQQRSALIDEVVVLNLEVAVSLASRHRNKGVSRDDLEQVASMALVRAAQRFDASMEYDFLSYAVPTIRGELRRYFRDHGWTVRPPRRVQEIQAQAIETRDNLAEHRGSVPSEAEIAAALGEDEATIREALAAEGCFTPTSLDTPAGHDSGLALGEVLGDVDRDAEAAEARVVLQPVVRQLSDRDRRILQMRFFDECTQQEIADEIGVTQMQVSRLLTRIMRDLRRALEDAPETVAGGRTGTSD